MDHLAHTVTTLEAAFDGERVQFWVNGHRLRLLWTVAGLAWAAVAFDWARTWKAER